jgi:hypothetical protein
MDVKRNGWFFLFRTLISSGIAHGYLFHLRFMRGLFQEPQLHPPPPPHRNRSCVSIHNITSLLAKTFI